MVMDIVRKDEADDEYTIKPQSSAPAVDTSTWPLLLKNYEKRMSIGGAIRWRRGSRPLPVWNG